MENMGCNLLQGVLASLVPCWDLNKSVALALWARPVSGAFLPSVEQMVAGSCQSPVLCLSWEAY